MARKRSPSPMKAAIIKGASNLFFEIGYSKTTPKAVCEKADVGTGNLTLGFSLARLGLCLFICKMKWSHDQISENHSILHLDGISERVSSLIHLKS